MDKPKQGLEEAVDRVLNNPAYDMLGGYHMFLRRVTIPILLIPVSYTHLTLPTKA